ncbi:MAG: HepT-like ribonuclease domain-containing protein [Candidatus Promineifilaceae bacterium]
MRPETLYLADILEAAEAMAEFVEGMDESDFNRDAKTQSAVIQKLIVIG